MNNLSDRINNLPISETLAMAARARELREKGRDIISLSLGEPDFYTPDFVKEAAIKAIHENYSTYSPVDGYLELKQAIARKFKRDNNLEYSPKQIVISTGAKQSIANVVLALVNPGDEVLLPAPYWVSYDAIVRLAEGIPVPIYATIDSDFKITPEQLEAAITPKTKLVFFNSPSNPSGMVYSKEEYEALAKVIAKHNHVYVISDEIYEHITFEGTCFSFAASDGMYERTVTINGVSKSFAMTGWRIGYIGAPEWIAKACNKMQGQITSGPNSIAQRAVIAALDAPISSIQYMVDEFHKRRDLVYNLISGLKGFKVSKPNGAFYVLPNIAYYFGKELKGKKINNALDFSMFLLDEANVATVSGEAFGAPNCIRISYAASQEVLIEAIARIKKAIES